MRNIDRRREPYTKFKGFLVENNIKQSEVAKLLNKSKSALNQNINGTGGDFSIAELKLLYKIYGISIDKYFIT